MLNGNRKPTKEKHAGHTPSINPRNVPVIISILTTKLDEPKKSSYHLEENLKEDLDIKYSFHSHF